jgi:hypothetical protein
LLAIKETRTRYSIYDRSRIRCGGVDGIGQGLGMEDSHGEEELVTAGWICHRIRPARPARPAVWESRRTGQGLGRRVSHGIWPRTGT